MVKVLAPPEFRAVIVQVVLIDRAVGVPEISPVAIFNVKPSGNAGVIEYPYKLDEESNTLNYLDILEKHLPNMDSILPNFEMENFGEIDEQEMEKQLMDEF